MNIASLGFVQGLAYREYLVTRRHGLSDLGKVKNKLHAAAVERSIEVITIKAMNNFDIAKKP